MTKNSNFATHNGKTRRKRRHNAPDGNEYGNGDMMSRRGEKKKERQQAELEASRQYAEEYYEYDASQRADVSSLRKSRKYMVAGIVSLLLMLLAGLGAYMMRGTMVASEQTASWAYEQRVEQFATSYASQNGLSSYPTYLEDIPGFDDIARTKPSDEAFTWNPVTGQCTGADHGHYPTGWNAPKSVSQGVTTTVTDTNDN